MSRPEDVERVAAACVDCGAVYAAHRWPDGNITPIGSSPGCRCGGEEFVDLSSDDDGLNP